MNREERNCFNGWTKLDCVWCVDYVSVSTRLENSK